MADSHEKTFRGAGVIVCKPNEVKTPENVILVESAHAEEISSLIFKLKKIFANSIDCYSKYEFYGRLAKAANRQIYRYGDDAAAIKNAMLEEACTMAGEMGSHLYFAYGSNVDAKQMAHRCPESLFVGTAVLENHGFALDSAGVATVLKKPGSQVYGALWLISESDERSLDRYEGVDTGCYRKSVCLISALGVLSNALLYLSNRGSHDGLTYRSGYLDRIIENAKRLGFKATYIESLEANLNDASPQMDTATNF